MTRNWTTSCNALQRRKVARICQCSLQICNPTQQITNINRKLSYQSHRNYTIFCISSRCETQITTNSTLLWLNSCLSDNTLHRHSFFYSNNSHFNLRYILARYKTIKTDTTIYLRTKTLISILSPELAPNKIMTNCHKTIRTSLTLTQP